MKNLLVFAVSFWVIQAGANQSCQLLERASLALSVHAANWSNAITTRTPKGGPYKVKVLKCAKHCRVVEEEHTTLKYEPGHPDADAGGYVTYPVIDKSAELAAISANAEIIRNMGKACPEKVKVTDKVNSAMIEYKSGSTQIDVFNFNDNSNLTSWVRQTKSGEQIINF